MTRFAAQTTVPAENSRAEIERLVMRYGAEQFVSGWQATSAVLGFTLHKRMVRFQLAMPAKDSKEFTHTPERGFRRTQEEAHKAWEQATRQRWRAMALVIKAKLEAVESGISTFEHEFLANIVLPDGATVGAWIGPQIAEAYETQRMPNLLPGVGESSAGSR